MPWRSPRRSTANDRPATLGAPCTGSRSCSRTTSTLTIGCRPLPAHWRWSARRHSRTQRSPPACARLGPSSSARRPSVNGRTSAPSSRRAAGPGAAASATIPTRSTATRAGRAQDRVRRPPRTSPRFQSGQRRMAASCAPPTRTAWSESNPPSAWSAGPGSCRSRILRTRSDPMPVPSPTRRRFLAPSSESTRAIRRRRPALESSTETTRSSWIQMASTASASASRVSTRVSGARTPTPFSRTPSRPYTGRARSWLIPLTSKLSVSSTIPSSSCSSMN